MTTTLINLYLYCQAVLLHGIRYLALFILRQFHSSSGGQYLQTVSAVGQKSTLNEEFHEAFHPAGLALQFLINAEAGDSWPPRSTHGSSWPEALQPYHEVYLDLAPSLSQTSEELSGDYEKALERCQVYRDRMTRTLKERVCLDNVEKVLEAGEGMQMDAKGWNGFFACIALSRHAFRWGTIPVVKLVQEEREVQLPAELNLPWTFLRRRYGISSQGGNVTSNYLCNFDDKDEIVFPINVGMSEMITSAEYHFAHVFVAIERAALPIYRKIVVSIFHYTHKQQDACLLSLREACTLLRNPIKIYYETMTNSKIDRRVWMAYVQGFQGWAAGEVIDDEYIEYDGLSGNQLLFPQVIDAFLGLESYLPPIKRLRYMPALQREFVDCIRANSFRQAAQAEGLDAAEMIMRDIAKQMRVFRVAHRSRVRPYLTVPAPERLAMTAGKGVLENEKVVNIEQAIDDVLDVMLVDRLKQTR